MYSCEKYPLTFSPFTLWQFTIEPLSVIVDNFNLTMYYCSVCPVVHRLKFLGCFLLHKRATPEQSLKCDHCCQLSHCMKEWKHCPLVVMFQVFLFEDVLHEVERGVFACKYCK